VLTGVYRRVFITSKLTKKSSLKSDGRETLFGAAGGAATGRRAASAGGAGSAFELSTDGESKGGHYPMNLFALTFGTGNLF
jgi:hypothetical protein